jgi:NTP pyrophosphatase (non-canonical NTP hydrolase)
LIIGENETVSHEIGHDRLDNLRDKLREFVAERDWAQFHNPKNLAMALIAEAGELVEHFQWLTPGQADRLSPEALTEVEHELADVLIFLVELADRLDVDLLAAAERKLQLNAEKYPVEKARGRAIKYNKL